jgi:hypothetical protein
MDAGVGCAAGAVALATSAEKKTRKKGFEMKISNNFGSPRRNPPQAAWIDRVSEPEIAGITPREDPMDGTPRNKARSGEVAVDRTKAVAAIKGGREAETLKEEVDDAGVDDDEVASGGRRRPTMATTVADAATSMTTRPRTAGAIVPRQSPTRPASTTTRSRAAGAAVPLRPRPSPTRPTSMTTRPQTGPRTVL